ncbi:hypothetical protein ACTXGQ_03795 [Marinobacter sp. 1Y8]
MSIHQTLSNRPDANARMKFFALDRIFRRLLLACSLSACGLGAPALAQTAEANSQAPEAVKTPVSRPVALTVEGISVRASDDYPRVLNILPWQAPSVSTRSRDPLSMEPSGLLEPVDPGVLQRHQQFRKTLDPLAEPVSQP